MGLTKPRAAQIYNLDYKQATRVVTTTNITLTGGAPNSVDGVNLSVNDRVLVTGQSTASQNGLYYVSTVGSGANGTWVRTGDANQTGEIDAGMIVMVTEGAVYADTQWKLITDNPITVGTTGLTFTQNYSANSISSGSSNVTVNANANVTISSAGTPNVLIITSTGTVIKGSESVSGNVTVGNLAVVGTVSSNLIPASNNTSTLGSPTNVWQHLYVGPNSLYLGGNSLSSPNGVLTWTTGGVSGNILMTSGPPGTMSVSGNVQSGNIINTGLITATGNITGGNILTGGLISATGNVSGNYLLANIAYATGYTASKIYNGTSEANIGTNGGNANISIGGTSNVVVWATTGEYVTGVVSASGNITGSNIATSGLMSATGNVTGSNVVATANVTGGNVIASGIVSATGNISGQNLQASGTVSAVGNIFALGNVSTAGNVISSNVSTVGLISATANITGGNINTAGNVSGNYLLANIYYATGFSASRIFNGTSEANIGTSGGNANISIGGVSNVVVFASTGEYITGLLSVTGNITGGNLLTGGLISATANITGGNILTAGLISATGNLKGNNISAVGDVNANNLLTPGVVSATGNITGGNISATNHTGTSVSVTGTVTAASTVGGVITGSSASVTGNVTSSNLVASTTITNGNITITGANIVSTGPTLYIDPNGAGGTDGNVIIAGNLSVQGNVTYINSNTVTTNDLFINVANNASSASQANGGGLGVGPVGSEYISLTYNSSSNIWVASNGLTSQGILSATGNVTGGNILTTGLISSTGNITSGNIVTGGLISATGNATAGNLSTGGQLSSTGNITSSGNITAGNLIGNFGLYTPASISATFNLNAGGYVSATGNVLGGNIISYGLTTTTGNITGGNVLTAGLISATGKITGAYLFGNASQVTGVNAFKTVAVSGGSQSNIVANSIASTLTFAAGTGLVWTTDANTGIITISTTSSGTSIFSTGGDMGLVTDPVTASEDLGNVTDVATVFYDLGSVVSASGLIYPSQLILPTYTPGTLPSASPAAQFLYLSTSSIGPMTAFSDGTNWRFTSSGNIVS